jgi:hypothetical protein
VQIAKTPGPSATFDDEGADGTWVVRSLDADGFCPRGARLVPDALSVKGKYVIPPRFTCQWLDSVLLLTLRPLAAIVYNGMFVHNVGNGLAPVGVEGESLV